MKILRQDNIPQRETKPSVASPRAKHRNSIANTMMEKDLQNNIIQLATSLGYEHYHTYNSFRSDPGFPDLVLARLEPSPRLIYVECKRERKNPTPEQQKWIDLLKGNGQRVYVWRPSDWLNDTILNILGGK